MRRGIAVMEDEGQLTDHTAGLSATDGTWHHIAVTWQSSDGSASFYDNGRKVHFILSRLMSFHLFYLPLDATQVLPSLQALMQSTCIIACIRACFSDKHREAQSRSVP